jgi:crossover junction endodeoxyribonuclease RuvC
MSQPPRVVGLDLSLTSTGVAIICGTAVRLARIEPGDKGGDHARIDRIRSRVWELADGANLAVIEGPSYGSVTGKQHERAGLWWIVTRMLWRAGLPYAVVTPSQLKKYATGKGAGPASGKDKVLAVTVRRYPMADVDGNDVADALTLAAMAADHLGHPLATVPQAQRAVLAGVRWPAPTPTT